MTSDAYRIDGPALISFFGRCGSGSTLKYAIDAYGRTVRRPAPITASSRP